MNIPNAEKLLEHLEWIQDNGLERKFDMTAYLQHPLLDRSALSIVEMEALLAEADINEPVSGTECGTAACYAGHVGLLFNAPKDANLHIFARGALELTNEQAGNLFFGYWKYSYGIQDEAVPISLAIQHLKHIISHGAPSTPSCASPPSHCDETII